MIERLSASNAAKHLGCHASANLPLAIPGWTPAPQGGDTPASIKGSAMHEIMEKAAEYSATEMLGIATAMTYVADLRKKRRFKKLIEEPSSGWWLKAAIPPSTKADLVLYVADELHVVDYKFGRIAVDVNNNTQGKYYSLAYLPLAPKAKEVTFHIVQPFADNIASVCFSLAELEEFKQETLDAEAAIAAKDVTFTPGDHCMFCPANPHGRGGRGEPACPAMLSMLYPLPTVDEDAILDDL